MTEKKNEGYQFDLYDQTLWNKHLVDHGYVVIRNVATNGDVKTAKDLIWRDIESAEEISRDDPSTWSAWSLPSTGLVGNLSQTEGSWYVRGIPKVKEVFTKIWNTGDLIVSMDAVILWKPYFAVGDERKSWRPYTEGLHLDQNPFSKPHLDCVQGMMPLIAVTTESGGLQVVPGSHTNAAKTAFKLQNKHMKGQGDWCPLKRNDPMYSDAKLLLADEGDLILWDSRTVHGGVVGTGVPPPQSELARISVTVAMTPRSKANEHICARRRAGFSRGESFNHCPHEGGTSSGTIHARRKPGYHDFKLNDAQNALL
eukprot:m.258732 g.258732  ORF g.258732 m.258732 type:complete len:312 (-) comp36976_c0_seq1:230-1165(-)